MSTIQSKEDKDISLDILSSGNGIALLIDDKTGEEWEDNYPEMQEILKTISVYDDRYTLIVEL